MEQVLMLVILFLDQQLLVMEHLDQFQIQDISLEVEEAEAVLLLLTQVDQLQVDLEVQEAVDALNYHKAAADDGTKNPMYKCGGEFMVELLGKLFNFLKMKEMKKQIIIGPAGCNGAAARPRTRPSRGRRSRRAIAGRARAAGADRATRSTARRSSAARRPEYS